MMRSLEDLQLIEHAKIILNASIARKASSVPLGFDRIDYPEVDPPEWNKFSTIKLENDKIKIDYKPQNFWGNMKEQYEKHNPDYEGVYKK
jgi:succinate dehydrogenase/fumarate reductase flavoprotein subunit